jgi:hypothetical protein
MLMLSTTVRSGLMIEGSKRHQRTGLRSGGGRVGATILVPRLADNLLRGRAATLMYRRYLKESPITTGSWSHGYLVRAGHPIQPT